MTLLDAPPPERADWRVAFQLVFDTSATPVAILDERRCLIDLNGAAERLLGLCPDVANGEPIDGAVAESDRERSEADWRRLLREGHMTGTRTLLRGDRSEVHVVFAAVVQALADGRRAIYTLTPAHGGETAMRAPSGALTKREEQVVGLIAEGLDTAEIADSLHVSPNTVRSHVRNAMSKLGARTRAQLVAQAFAGARAAEPR